MYFYNFICKLGKGLVDYIFNIGQATIMLLEALVAKPDFRHFPLFIKQVYNLYVRSLPIILISGFFIGAVLAIQGYSILSRFKGESFLGVTVVISVLRELAPTVTGLLYAGRAGSSLTAEIALMKSTEQLSSLEMMAVDPLRRVIAPRFWASMVSMPMLTITFMAMAVLASSIVGLDWKQISPADYWGTIHTYIGFYDFWNGFYKSLLFSFFISWIAVYKGYAAVPNAEGISKATTDTVVVSSLSILVIDLLLTLYLYG